LNGASDFALISDRTFKAKTKQFIFESQILFLQGFSSSLFAYYRDKNGDPMSPRMPVSGQPYISK